MRWHPAPGRRALVVAGLALLTACAPPDAHWSEEARLADGTIIGVARAVSFTNGCGGDLSTLLTACPSRYAISISDPASGTLIRWRGTHGFQPVAVGFEAGAAFLVVHAFRHDADLAQYGCPDIPFVFLRHDRGRSHWQQVQPDAFPRALLRPNLSHVHVQQTMSRGARLDVGAVDKDVGQAVRSRHLSDPLPTRFTEWTYRHRNAWRVGRGADGCRHVVPSNADPAHPQRADAPAIRIQPEVLRDEVLDPPKVYTDWNAATFDPRMNEQCRALVQRVGDDSDRPEMRGWLAFKRDPTGTRKARPGAHELCDDRHVWIVAYDLTPDLVLDKFDADGRFVHRIRMPKPEAPIGEPGFLVHRSFRAGQGKLDFEWWNGHQTGSEWRVVRRRQLQLREPE